MIVALKERKLEHITSQKSKKRKNLKNPRKNLIMLLKVIQEENLENKEAFLFPKEEILLFLIPPILQ